eukprot:TRINITY_DN13035_c1_g3_i2.p1 TRINITY_DN13035_c1_g3~~TRINITY_DN13035_c1_g3_i2.p1  ORF type:complete len:550 (-),score=87.82 TRINITY_DN13035_c1_g3_i2:305-1741(-)
MAAARSGRGAPVSTLQLIAGGGSGFSTGTVKSYSFHNGYGFINSHDHNLDIYFKVGDLNAEAQQRIQNSNIIGEGVSFELQSLPDGKLRARRVSFSGAGAPLAQQTQQPPQAKANANGRPRLPPPQEQPPTLAAATAGGGSPKCQGLHRPEMIDEAVAQLTSMGFSEAAARETLSGGLDVGKALDVLLAGGSAAKVSAKLEPAHYNGNGAANGGSYSNGKENGVARSLNTVKLANGIGGKNGYHHPVVDAAEKLDSSLILKEARADTCEKSLPAPRRHLARVGSKWSGENDVVDHALQLQVGSLVRVWSDSTTGIGWVYVERLAGDQEAGWVPTSVLIDFHDGFKLMKTCEAYQSNAKEELTVTQGLVVLADMKSINCHGWTFVELRDGSQSGWLPFQSLEEIPPSYKWMRASRSCEASHSTQLSVKENDNFLIDLGTCTDDGWIYAWAAETGDMRLTSTDAGWVPFNCFQHDAEANV